MLNLLQAKIIDELEIQLEEEKALRLDETTKQNERFDRLESEFVFSTHEAGKGHLAVRIRDRESIHNSTKVPGTTQEI